MEDGIRILPGALLVLFAAVLARADRKAVRPAVALGLAAGATAYCYSHILLYGVRTPAKWGAAASIIALPSFLWWMISLLLDDDFRLKPRHLATLVGIEAIELGAYYVFETLRFAERSTAENFAFVTLRCAMNSAICSGSHTRALRQSWRLTT